MKLIVVAALLTALALPAQAQRLDTRVREAKATDRGLECRLNANRDTKIEPGTGRWPSMAVLLQRPEEQEAWLRVKLGFTFEPQGDGRFGLSSRLFAFGILDMRMAPAPPPIKVRLLIDGSDSGVPMKIFVESDNPNDLFVEVPHKRRAEIAERILRARWVDVEVVNRDKTVRRYRFDALRIADAAEILSLVKFRCDGPRAD